VQVDICGLDVGLEMFLKHLGANESHLAFM